MAPFICQFTVWLGWAAATFRAAASTSTGAEVNAAVEFEAIHGKIYFNRLDLFQEIFVNDVFITFYIINLIGVFRLIQSHSKSRTASPAFVKKDPDGRNFLALEIFFNLFSCCRSYLDHDTLLSVLHVKINWVVFYFGMMQIQSKILYENLVMSGGFVNPEI